MAIIDGGRILYCGSTTGAVDSLRGKVWRKVIGKGELAGYDSKHRVIVTRLLAGRMEIHVQSDAVPDETFDPVEPDLEDFYFSIIMGRHETSS